MMSSDLPWKSYIERTTVTLQFLGFDVESEEFTESFGLKPTYVKRGIWCYETVRFVSSNNVNEHLRHLLRVFLPFSKKIEDLRPNTTVVVSINWETNVPFTGGGPIIESDCVSGLAQLGANLFLEILHLP